MRRRELLASTTTPDGMRMTLSLHAGDYRIEVDGQGLMSTPYCPRTRSTPSDGLILRWTLAGSRRS